MKIKIMFKDPDGVDNAITDAASEQVAAIDGLSTDESERVEEVRKASICESLKPWILSGEYLEVEFDTAARTATVLPAR